MGVHPNFYAFLVVNITKDELYEYTKLDQKSCINNHITKDLTYEICQECGSILNQDIEPRFKKEFLDYARRHKIHIYNDEFEDFDQMANTVSSDIAAVHLISKDPRLYGFGYQLCRAERYGISGKTELSLRDFSKLKDNLINAVDALDLKDQIPRFVFDVQWW